MFQREGQSSNKCNRISSFLLKRRELQFCNAKLLRPLITIGIVVYAFTLISQRHFARQKREIELTKNNISSVVIEIMKAL